MINEIIVYYKRVFTVQQFAFILNQILVKEIYFVFQCKMGIQLIIIQSALIINDQRQFNVTKFINFAIKNTQLQFTFQIFVILSLNQFFYNSVSIKKNETEKQNEQRSKEKNKIKYFFINLIDFQIQSKQYLQVQRGIFIKKQ
ncbi:transmembrane protein, putative (macronuclear) [Tetrahymena thermophila SB210]|uniref:Transmembrane protein, putative n=1 Tax=Tetrahymena thermophila (strain SB210) TaxID=312017 RepID=W7XCZ3_TETTS|nr:transmembrane protein, putative [Tetrahymena thermophila SB210]EWS75332.1 transmembrane protein, putative [Tetrahymena thermophila SB210]|eukprot:XP_012652121.1 transmembrane protein, putative [Tetrahymena thermophila SB210]